MLSARSSKCFAPSTARVSGQLSVHFRITSRSPTASMNIGKTCTSCRGAGGLILQPCFDLARLLRHKQVDVLHAFLFDAEIIGRLAAPLAGVPVVIASERNADYTRPPLHDFALRLTQPLVDALVANSFAGKQFTLRTTRFKDSQIHVVHNGVDTIRFRPDREARATFRRGMGLLRDALRLRTGWQLQTSEKEDVFLRMSAKIASRFDNAVFLIAGSPTGGRLAPSRTYQKEIEALAVQLVFAIAATS